MSGQHQQQHQQYSQTTEAYAAQVVAVGGEWPHRVAVLRQTFPGNEAQFKQALEKQVYAAHQAHNQQQQQQQQQQKNDSGEAQSPSTATSTSFPGQGARSYPGQQAAPAPPMSAPGYVPYAQTVRAGSIGPSTGSPIGPSSRRSLGPSSLQGSPAVGSGLRTATSFNQSSTVPRTSSALNPAAAASSTAGTSNELRNAAAKIVAQKLPAPYPVYKSRDPLPPFFPISPGQAYMTTYPSRLKLGTTNLMQPVTASGAVVSAATAAANAAGSAAGPSKSGNPLSAIGMPKKRSHTKREKSEEPIVVAPSPAAHGRRARTKVDYKEKIDIPGSESSSDDDEEEEEEAPQEQVVQSSRSGRIIKSRSGVSMSALANTSAAAKAKRDSPAPAKKKRKREKEGSAAPGGDELGGGGRTYLGQEVPAELIKVQAARRHMLPYQNEKELKKRAHEAQMLVPVRIDLDTETHRIRDAFVWDLNDTQLTPETFAKIFCLDADLAYEPYGVQIASSIQSQLDEHTGVAEVALLPPEHEAYYSRDRHEGCDLRVILNLDLQIGTLHLVDRVEWDLTCTSITPEQFAKQLCADLGLGGEAVMMVAHAVHEEIFRTKREVIELGLIGKNLVDLGRLQAATAGMPGRSVLGPKKLDSVWRDWNESKMYGPHVEILTPEHIDALESEKERNPRRLRGKAQNADWQAASRERAGRRRI